MARSASPNPTRHPILAEALALLERRVDGRAGLVSPRRGRHAGGVWSYFFTNFCRHPPDLLASQPAVRPPKMLPCSSAARFDPQVRLGTGPDKLVSKRMDVLWPAHSPDGHYP